MSESTTKLTDLKVNEIQKQIVKPTRKQFNAITTNNLLIENENSFP